MDERNLKIAMSKSTSKVDCVIKELSERIMNYVRDPKTGEELVKDIEIKFDTTDFDSVRFKINFSIDSEFPYDDVSIEYLSPDRGWFVNMGVLSGGIRKHFNKQTKITSLASLFMTELFSKHDSQATSVMREMLTPIKEELDNLTLLQKELKNERFQQRKDDTNRLRYMLSRIPSGAQFFYFDRNGQMSEVLINRNTGRTMFWTVDGKKEKGRMETFLTSMIGSGVIASNLTYWETGKDNG